VENPVPEPNPQQPNEGKHTMKTFFRMFTGSLCAILFSATTMAAQYLDADHERDSVRESARATLEKLYATQPDSKQVIEGAAGYAVFSNFGVKILLAGGGTGKGIAVNNKTKAETFMKMAEVQAGLGLGVKSYNLVWVFQTQAAFDQFVNSGWEFGGQATAAAKADNAGGAVEGAVSVAPGVWLYQMTKNGLALELTVKSTKYYKDSDLN
jgi:lipid-binding SYLF domain-containing protein